MRPLGAGGQLFLLRDIVILVLSMIGGMLMAGVIAHYVDLYVPERMSVKFLLGLLFVSAAIMLRRRE